MNVQLYNTHHITNFELLGVGIELSSDTELFSFIKL